MQILYVYLFVVNMLTSIIAPVDGLYHPIANETTQNKYKSSISDHQTPLSKANDSITQINERIRMEFSVTETEAEQQLKQVIGTYTQEQKKTWETKGWLEYRILNGEKRYFNRAVRNLKLRLQQQSDSIQSTKTLDSFDTLKTNLSALIIDATTYNGELSNPQDFKITYSIRLQANAIPAGEVVRCWMPWPKENHSRQTNVKLRACSSKTYQIANTKVGQRSLYMEKKTVANKPTEFTIQFSFRSYAQYVDIEQIATLPYNQHSELYKKYTSEQKPHILFSKEIQRITDSITAKATKPTHIVKSIYQYICQNYIWSGALEYSIIPCIPNYVLENRKGDCGMQTLLFMSMARYKGIPVRWQSGWMLHPGEVNLHDWCEVYYEGQGWVPLDMSFQLNNSNDRRVRNFYLSGIDAYRLIVNDEIGTALTPQKNYLRSEPYDFQRGELEWRGGNIYFDKWDYKMKIEK